MDWSSFIYFGLISIILGVISSFFCWKKEKTLLISLFTILQILVLAFFVFGFWIEIKRPPFKTMGETRLWFSLFMPIAGWISYKFWNYKWMIPYGTVLSTVFILINLLKPEIHTAELMPALQSIYFVPHVSIYMIAYAFLGGSFVLAFVSLFKKDDLLLKVSDKLVLIGICGLGIGMLLGSLWAKEAWGTYWDWDPKETWALVTFFGYLFYFHLRMMTHKMKKMSILLLLISFLALQMCWYGVNFVPSANKSLHRYSELQYDGPLIS